MVRKIFSAKCNTAAFICSICNEPESTQNIEQKVSPVSWYYRYIIDLLFRINNVFLLYRIASTKSLSHAGFFHKCSIRIYRAAKSPRMPFSIFLRQNSRIFYFFYFRNII